MVLTQEQLAERLRRAREASGLTQEKVAEALGVSRPVVVQMEAGKRPVSSLELSKYGQAVGLSIADLLAEKGPITQVLMARFRATAAAEEVPALEQTMLNVVRLCRLATRLERELGSTSSNPLPPKYEVAAPNNKAEAVRQGEYVAVQERKRIGLGPLAPVWDLPGVLEPSGIRVTEHALPAEVSGFSFVSEETGPVIVVNREQPLVRRQFSCAHELAHIVLDRDRGPMVSVEGSKDLPEVRADVFASRFLVPSSALDEQLTAMGKSDGAINAFDVAHLAYHFRVSWEVLLYRLKVLKKITKTECESLLKSDDGRRLASELWPNHAMKGPYGNSLLMWVLRVAFEAYRREIISRKKAIEIGVDVGVPKGLLENELRLTGEAEATQT